MASIHHCQITDDDGVLILATEANLRALCPPHFDYAFPGVVLDGLRTSRDHRREGSTDAIEEFEVHGGCEQRITVTIRVGAGFWPPRDPST